MNKKLLIIIGFIFIIVGSISIYLIKEDCRKQSEGANTELVKQKVYDICINDSYINLSGFVIVSGIIISIFGGYDDISNFFLKTV